MVIFMSVLSMDAGPPPNVWPFPVNPPGEDVAECLRVASSRALHCRRASDKVTQTQLPQNFAYALFAPRTWSTFCCPFRKIKVGLRTIILSNWFVGKIGELHCGDGITTSNILGHVDITLEEVHVIVLAC